MATRYLFRSWARTTIGSTQPAAAQRWFADRGLNLSRETYRKFLSPRPPASLMLSTWERICEASGEPLSTFVEVKPSGPAPEPTPPPPPAPKAKDRTPKPGAPQRPAPPCLADFARSFDG
jgi:hypothetical protein